MTPTVHDTPNSLSKIEFLPTLFMQTLRVSLPEASTWPMLTPHLMTFVLQAYAPLPIPNFPGSNSLNYFCNQNRIIHIKQFCRQARSELSRQRLQHKDEKQRAEDRALLHTHSNIESLFLSSPSFSSLHPHTLLSSTTLFIHPHQTTSVTTKPPPRAPFQTLSPNQQRPYTGLVFLLC